MIVIHAVVSVICVSTCPCSEVIHSIPITVDRVLSGTITHHVAIWREQECTTFKRTTAAVEAQIFTSSGAWHSLEARPCKELQLRYVVVDITSSAVDDRSNVNNITTTTRIGAT